MPCANAGITSHAWTVSVVALVFSVLWVAGVSAASFFDEPVMAYVRLSCNESNKADECVFAPWLILIPPIVVVAIGWH